MSMLNAECQMPNAGGAVNHDAHLFLKWTGERSEAATCIQHSGIQH
jgi:hypothetical protein